MTNSERFFSLARRLTAGILWVLAALAILWLLFDWLLPFSLAFATTYLLYPLSQRLGKKTGMSHAALRVFLLFFLLFSLSTLLLLGALRLTRELKDFFLSFYESFDSLAATALAWLERLKAKLPLSGGFSTEALSALLRDSVKNAMASLSAKWASAAASMASKLPATLFALFIFLMALFYFTLDYERVTAYLRALIPCRYRQGLSKARTAFHTALKSYLRAYFILFLLVFFLLWLSFLFLKVDYAFLLALTAAALDSLPAIGVGILLIPWSLFLLLQGNTARGIVLLAIYLGITLLRRALEPRVLGKALGIHPLLSLAALYVGFRFFGFLGILLSPLAALALARGTEAYRKSLIKKESLPKEL